MCSPDISTRQVEDRCHLPASVARTARKMTSRAVSRCLSSSGGPSAAGRASALSSDAVQQERAPRTANAPPTADPTSGIAGESQQHHQRQRRTRWSACLPSASVRFRDSVFDAGSSCAFERQRIGFGSGHEPALDHRQPLAMLHLAERPAVRHRQPQDRRRRQRSSTKRRSPLPVLPHSCLHAAMWCDRLVTTGTLDMAQDGFVSAAAAGVGHRERDETIHPGLHSNTAGGWISTIAS